MITRTAQQQAAGISRAMAQLTATFWKPVNGSALRFAGGFLAWVFLWWILMFYVMFKVMTWAAIEAVLLLALAGVLIAGMAMRPAERHRDLEEQRRAREVES